TDGSDAAERSLRQHEVGLLALRETVTGGGHLHPLDDEAAFLEHPQRCAVAGRDVSVQRTNGDFEHNNSKAREAIPLPQWSRQIQYRTLFNSFAAVAQ